MNILTAHVYLYPIYMVISIAMWIILRNGRASKTARENTKSCY